MNSDVHDVVGEPLDGSISVRPTLGHTSRYTILATFNGSTIRDYQYAYDILGRITNRVDNGMQMNAFTYNPRSEVLTALFGTNGLIAARREIY